MRTLILAFCMWSAAAFASLTFGPLAADTNATRTTIDVLWSLTATNGIAPTVTVYWAMSDAGTNSGAWAYSTNLGTKILATYTNRLAGLTPSRPWYVRLLAQDTNALAWSTNYAYAATLSGAPTSAAPGHAYVPIMVSTSGVIVAPTNIQDFVTGSGASLTNTKAAAVAAQATANSAITNAASAQATATTASGHRMLPSPMLHGTNGVVAWRPGTYSWNWDSGVSTAGWLWADAAWPAGISTNVLVAPDGLGTYTWTDSTEGMCGYFRSLQDSGSSSLYEIVSTNGVHWSGAESAGFQGWYTDGPEVTPWPPKPGVWSVDSNGVPRWAYQIDGFLGTIPGASVVGAVPTSAVAGAVSLSGVTGANTMAAAGTGDFVRVGAPVGAATNAVTLWTGAIITAGNVATGGSVSAYFPVTVATNRSPRKLYAQVSWYTNAGVGVHHYTNWTVRMYCSWSGNGGFAGSTLSLGTIPTGGTLADAGAPWVAYTVAMVTNGVTMTPALTGSATMPSYIRVFVHNDGHLNGLSDSVTSLGAAISLGVDP